MNFKYLKNIKTLEDLKKEYHRFAMILHPDRGGSDDEMKILNAEYTFLFENVKNKHQDKTGKKYEKETSEKPSEFKDVIDELLKFDGIFVEVIGCFIWVTGNTKPYKEDLKKLKFRWHKQKKCWYRSPENYRRYGKAEYSMDEIRDMYGVEFSEEVRANKIKVV